MENQTSHRWPQVLPGSRWVIFLHDGGGAHWDQASTALLSLESGEYKTIHRGGLFSRYLPTGHLVFVYENTLFAAPFDLNRGKLSTGPVPVADEILQATGVGLAHYSAELSGWQLVLVAVMPVLGHACTPFLNGRGGKSVAVTFGIWSGLTLWEGPTAAGLFMTAGVALFGFNGRAVLLGMLGLLAYVVASDELLLNATRPDMLVLLGVWVLNLAIIVWKHRGELATTPRLSSQDENLR